MGSKGGTSPSTSIIQPGNPQVPNAGLLNSLAMWRSQASSPYMASPWRAMDYLSQYQTPTQNIPQFNPQGSQGLGPSVQNSSPQMQAQAQMGQNPMGGMGGGMPGMGPMNQNNLPQNWWNQAQMQVPTGAAQQGMAQNVSPSLAGLGQILMGVLSGGMGMPPGQQPPGGIQPAQGGGAAAATNQTGAQNNGVAGTPTKGPA
jgi:hypothetical protein